MNTRILFFSLFLFISLAFAGNLTGTVKNLATGTGIPSASVYVYDSWNVLVAQAQTDGNGVFTAQNITGHFVLRVVKDGYTNGYFTADVGASENKDIGDLLIVPHATLHLSVKDNASAYIQNGIVKVMQNGDTLVAQLTGPSGDIKVSPGAYTVVFLAPYYTIQSFQVSVSPAEEVTLTSSLEPTQLDTTPKVISVRVELSDNSVVAGDEVTVRAVARYDDMREEDVTYAASWNVNGAGAFYVPTLIATKYGANSIEATFSGKSGSSQLNVSFGTPVSLDLQASSTSIYTDQNAILTSYLVDRYSNLQGTSNVTYSTTCGSIQGSVFSSPSECTAVVTSVYNQNSSLNDSITISVAKRSSSDGGSKGSSRGSSTRRPSYTQSTPSQSTIQNTSHTEEPIIHVEEKTIKFIFPPSVYVGDTVTVTVLDTQSDPVDGAVITLERPDNSTISLVSQNGGRMSFVAYYVGDYILKSTKYTITGDTKITAKPLPTSESLQRTRRLGDKRDGIKESNDNVSGGTSTPSKDMSMLDAIFAAFSGEISIADAIRTTAPLWLVIGAVLLVAAIFFVVYTFILGGRPQGTSTDAMKEHGKQLVIQQSMEPLPPEHVDAIAEQISHSETPVDNEDNEKELKTEIGQLKKELRERMERLKQLKKGKGIDK
ncbi:MAG: hypothetical protein ACP5KJ_02670 [Candidatus Micrarchaeia archaeon]